MVETIQSDPLKCEPVLCFGFYLLFDASACSSGGCRPPSGQYWTFLPMDHFKSFLLFFAPRFWVGYQYVITNQNHSLEGRWEVAYKGLWQKCSTTRRANY